MLTLQKIISKLLLVNKTQKIKLLIGAQNQETMNYAETSITAPLLASSTPYVTFDNPIEDSTVPLVYTMWLETADGKDSTSAIFTAI